MKLPLFLARKIYYHQDDKHKVSRPAIQIGIAGVAIGLAVMLVTVSVVLGFKNTIRDKVVGFGSHIQVGNFMTLQGNEQYPIAINDSMLTVLRKIKGVKHVERFAMKQGILKTNTDFLGVAFKGVGQEFDSTFIHQHMLEGCIPRFSDNSSSNQLLISKSIANKLHLRVGQKIFAYFIDEHGVRVRPMTIRGIYQTNLSQYDNIICFCDLYTAVRLNAWKPDQVSGAEISVVDFTKLSATADEVVTHINKSTDRYGETFSSKTIEELNPQIFSWLDLLDINVWIIIALMLTVAGVTMISGLLIIILERTSMIGILKALGARNSMVRHTFLWFATFVIGKGMLIGNAIGISLLMLQQFTGIVKLKPDTYYVDHVPVELSLPLIILLNVGTLLVCLFVLIAPSYLISFIQPAKSMRYE